MNYFTVEKISPSITRIRDLTEVYMYLVEGSRGALLIDTGTGIGNLKEQAAALTRLPLTVVVTHGHVDHAGGAALFDRVYLHEADYEVVKRHNVRELKAQYAELMTGAPPPAEVIVPDRHSGFTPIHDGHVFDLGGISVQALALPGHTQGMMTMLFREERSMLLGDGCNASLFLFIPESSTIERYRTSLLDFQTRYNGFFDTVYSSHGTGNLPKSVVQDCLDVCTDILEGRSDEEPFEFMGTHCLIAKKTNKTNADWERLDGKCGNIVYDKTRIR